MIRIALVADDDAVARRLVREELEGIGFSVLEARDGEEAWARFRREDPDLVTTDLRMPGLDGIELLRKIRNEAGSWVPVIVMTSHHDPKIFESVFAAGSGGATRFLHFCYGLDQLAELAEELLFEKVESVRERQRVLKLRDLAEQLAVVRDRSKIEWSTELKSAQRRVVRRAGAAVEPSTVGWPTASYPR